MLEVECDVAEKDIDEPGQSEADQEEFSNLGFTVDVEEKVDDISFHELSQKRSICAWNSVREGIQLQNVLQCLSTRCVQCGPHVYYSNSCLTKSHKYTNCYHTTREEWKVYVELHNDMSMVDCMCPL